jgi:hypothetical protein
VDFHELVPLLLHDLGRRPAHEILIRQLAFDRLGVSAQLL